MPPEQTLRPVEPLPLPPESPKATPCSDPPVTLPPPARWAPAASSEPLTMSPAEHRCRSAFSRQPPTAGSLGQWPRRPGTAKAPSPPLTPREPGKLESGGSRVHVDGVCTNPTADSGTRRLSSGPHGGDPRMPGSLTCTHRTRGRAGAVTEQGTVPRRPPGGRDLAGGQDGTPRPGTPKTRMPGVRREAQRCSGRELAAARAQMLRDKVSRAGLSCGVSGCRSEAMLGRDKRSFL